MKRIVKTAYGQYKPGDEVDLPDGAVYDESVFEPVEPEPEMSAPPATNTKKGDK